MESFKEKLTKQWMDVGNLALGVWLVISPLVPASGSRTRPHAFTHDTSCLSYDADAIPAWNAYVVGVIVAVAALAALLTFHMWEEWEEWVNVALAAWLIISPWLLGFATLAMALWNQLIVGILVGVLALWTVLSSEGGRMRANS
jgi:SPW repeat